MTDRRPAQRVRGSRTGRPIMALLDLLGRRWALRILWELARGPLKFRELQVACDQASPSVLNKRLRELREAGLVNSRAGVGYQLTLRAHDLGELLLPLSAWADTWAEAVRGDPP